MFKVMMEKRREFKETLTINITTFKSGEEASNFAIDLGLKLGLKKINKRKKDTMISLYIIEYNPIKQNLSIDAAALIVNKFLNKIYIEDNPYI